MKKKRWIGKIVRFAVILAVVLTLAGYGLSNLYLMSPKGRAFLAGKITRISGLDASLQGASWSPWNGVTCYGLRIEQPAALREAIGSPLLLVETVRLDPDWRGFLKRQLIIRSLDVESPILSLPVELLSQLPTPEQVPELASRQHDQVAAVAPEPQPPAASSSDRPVGPDVSPAMPNGKTPHPTDIESVIEIKDPTVWLNLSDARFRILSTFTEEPLYEIGKIGGRIPLGGKAADSEIEFKQVKSMGDILAGHLTIPLRWQGTVLRTKVVDFAFGGIDCKIEATIGLSGGMPFQIGAVIPEQTNRNLEFSENYGAKLGTIAGQGRFQGVLTNPGTWQGQWIAQALAIDGRFRENRNRFEHGHALVVYQGGMLRCADTRLIGESTSILGNATLLKDGRFAAIARIVSTPENLVAISKHTRPDHTAPHLTPLSTPQRAALDLRLFGTPGNFHYIPDAVSEPIPLN